MPTSPPGSSARRRCRQGGFTLLELLVVLAIAALALAVAAPRLGGALPASGGAAAARELASALRATRSEAVLRGAEAVLEIDVERRRYRVPVAGLERGLPAGAELTVRTARSERVRQTGRFRFFPDGSATGGEIELVAGGRAHAIRIDWLTGRVTLEAGGDAP